jgi:FkbM family methyltransferase
MKYRVSYAQNREDIILEAFFKDKKSGFYIDIGANDPSSDSVTKRFYDKGWRGINIEPQKRFFDLLCMERPGDINLNIGISDTEGVLNFREYTGHGLSTFAKDIMDEYERHPSEITKHTDYEVRVRTLEDVLSENNVGEISFMKVDVEGYEYEVLRSNNWKKYLPEIICIESNHILKDWRPLLEEVGYELVFFDGLNNYYVSPKSLTLAAEFSYPSDVLIGDSPVINYAFAEIIENLEQRLDEVVGVSSDTINENTRLSREIERLNREIEASRRVSWSMLLFIKSIDKYALYLITKLKYKKMHQKKFAKLAYDASTSAEQLLSLIRLYDSKDYPPKKPTVTLTYRVLITLYNVAHKLITKLLRTFLHKLRRIR